ncbi:hypothetical protein Sjap_008839 [Stephania japonica]|uniref:Uncharacterized protein n=1 Tax=Stephania japonica TaxID=461633 RepID=A0AAP0JR68_9MAGN
MMHPGGGLSCPIFNKRFEDMRSVDEEMVPYRRPAAKKLVNKVAGLESREVDLDLVKFSRGDQNLCSHLSDNMLLGRKLRRSIMLSVFN